MFGTKKSATKLLLQANKAEVAAAKAMAKAQAAQARVISNRQLASELQDREQLASLEKAVDTAMLAKVNATNRYNIAVAKLTTVKSAVAAAEKNLDAAANVLEDATAALLEAQDEFAIAQSDLSGKRE